MKLLIISNPASPATDYYRTVGPFTRLAQDYPEELKVTIISPETVVWFDIYQCDAVLFQRPNGSQIVGFMGEAHRMGKIILADIDDLLHGLPDSNPAQGHFEQARDSMNAALSYVHHLFVSTPPLKEFYSQFIDASRITIARNAWNPEDTPPRPNVAQNDPIRMLWRGSVTHLQDLHTIKPALRQMFKDPAFAVVMVGMKKFMLYDLPNSNIQYIEWLTLFNYFKMMRESAPDYGFFPLVRDHFNLCKSNIFAIECLWAGALPIVPAKFPEWDIPGLLRYETASEFLDILQQIKAGKVDKVKRVEDARAWLRKSLHIAGENEKRLAALKTL